jgi:hypothetical protein
MKTTNLILIFLAVRVTSFGQSVFEAGDSCTVSFTATNLYYMPAAIGPYNPVFGEAYIRLYDTNVAAGTVLRLEMYENDTSETPLCTSLLTATNPEPTIAGCSTDNAWQDLQGKVRVTMLSGSVRVHSLFLQIGKFNNGSYGRWMGGSVPPIPEPRLHIAPKSNGQVELTWGTNHTAFRLETAPALPSGIWLPVTNDVTSSGSRFSVIVSPGHGPAVFRLHQP